MILVPVFDFPYRYALWNTQTAPLICTLQHPVAEITLGSLSALRFPVRNAAPIPILPLTDLVCQHLRPTCVS